MARAEDISACSMTFCRDDNGLNDTNIKRLTVLLNSKKLQSQFHLVTKMVGIQWYPDVSRNGILMHSDAVSTANLWVSPKRLSPAKNIPPRDWLISGTTNLWEDHNQAGIVGQVLQPVENPVCHNYHFEKIRVKRHV